MSTLSESLPARPDHPIWPRVEHLGDDAVVITAGEALDEITEPAFAELVRQHLRPGVATLVLDLSAVSFLTTIGAVTLLESAHRTHLEQVALLLVTSPAVDRMLRKLDITDRFTSVPASRYHRAVTHG